MCNVKKLVYARSYKKNFVRWYEIVQDLVHKIINTVQWWCLKFSDTVSEGETCPGHAPQGNFIIWRSKIMFYFYLFNNINYLILSRLNVAETVVDAWYHRYLILPINNYWMSLSMIVRIMKAKVDNTGNAGEEWEYY